MIFVKSACIAFLLLCLSACSNDDGDGSDDVIAPTVVSTVPSNGAVDVAVSNPVSIHFSESMDTASITALTILMLDDSSNLVAGTLSYAGTTATYTPSSTLAYASDFRVIVTTGVHDLAGNPLASDYVFNFTTANVPDTTAPTVTSTSPADTATDISVASTISVIFSEPMDPVSITSSSYLVTDNASNPVAGTVSYTGTTATFTPSAPLSYGTTYTAKVTTAVKDLAGNPLAADYTWSFTTQLQWTLTVANSGTGSGTVTSSPAGISCGGDCTEPYVDATSVTLTATADSGTVFEGFSGDCSAIAPTCELLMTQDMNVTAMFNIYTATAAGNQLGLNGVNDVAVFDQGNIPPETALDLTTFTIEAWVYPLANQQMVVVTDSAYYLAIKPAPLRAEFAVLTSTGFPAFQAFSGISKPLQLNQWNHVAGMVDSASNTLWVAVNGEVSDPLLMGGNIDTSFTQLFAVGNSYPATLGDYPFIGRIDEVRLSSVVRYSISYPLLSIYTSDADTTALWHFDEAEGATAFVDATGAGFNLVGENGAATVIGNRDVINYAPTANAGSDKNYLTGATVTLDGSQSSDINGDTLSYSWTLDSIPPGSSASLTGADTASPEFTVDLDGDYVVSLEVNDGSVSSLTDSVTITALVPGAATAPLADTGQTLCYDSTGTIIGCAATGQDGEYSSTAMSFTDNADGTITDNVTGLVWQKCTVGQNNDATCSGTAVGYNWYEASGTYEATHNPSAIDVCGSLSLGGFADWRLPWIDELNQLTNYGADSPAIDTIYFPGTVSGVAHSYQSLSEYAGNTSDAWELHSVDGDSNIVDKTTSSFSFVRCARGTSALSPGNVDNGDGTVTDMATGLMWQQSPGDVAKSWSEALAYCEGLSFAGYTDWRLPNARELWSIVDTGSYDPALDEIYFTYSSNKNYWSSTTVTRVPSYAFYVDFLTGSLDINQKTQTNYAIARCVR